MPAVRRCATCLSNKPCTRRIKGSLDHLEPHLWNKKTSTRLTTHDDLRTRKRFGYKVTRQLCEATGCQLVTGLRYSQGESKIIEHALQTYKTERGLCCSCLLTHAISDKDELLLPLLRQVFRRPRSSVRRKVLHLLRKDETSQFSCMCEEIDL